MFGVEGQAAIIGLTWKLPSWLLGTWSSLGILWGSQKFPNNGWLDGANGWACVPGYTGICLRSGEDTALCVLGSYLNKSCQALASFPGRSSLCLPISGPRTLSVHACPSSVLLRRRRSLGTKVLELIAPDPRLSLLFCFLLDSRPWVNFRMKCVLKATAAVFIRGGCQLYLNWGGRVGVGIP